MDTIFNLGIKLITMLQGLGSWLTIPMKLFSFLGTEDFYMVVLPFLYWCVDDSLGFRMSVILLFSSCLNGACKLFFHGPRPYWYSSHVQNFVNEATFGVPSGHSQNAVVLWGNAASYLKKKWAWLAAAIIILLISVSRMYLGVHFPHDVLVGWILGGLLLFLSIRFSDPIRDWCKRKSMGQQILIVFLTSLIMILIAYIPYFWLKTSGWQAPQSWASYAAGAVNLESIFTNSGTFFGAMSGLIWLSHMGGFEIRASYPKLIYRFLVGLTGAFIIRYGLKAGFPEGNTLLGLSLCYVRYAFIGAWITGGAPWMFIKLKLADSYNK
jgi:membrane-associated phospholipid phosphatase